MADLHPVGGFHVIAVAERPGGEQNPLTFRATAAEQALVAQPGQEPADGRAQGMPV